MRLPQAVTNITTCAAVADCDLSQGQPVELVMKEGLLCATAVMGTGAMRIAMSDAKKGEDIGIFNVEGLVELQTGKTTVLKVPAIQGGGSRHVDLAKLKKELGKAKLVGAIGIESAHTGLSFLVVCTDNCVPSLIRRLEEEHIDYAFLDLGLKGNLPRYSNKELSSSSSANQIIPSCFPIASNTADFAALPISSPILAWPPV